MWFPTPMEAWAAQSAVRRYLADQSVSGPVSVYRHSHRDKPTTDWDAYFNELRKMIREEKELSYRNLVKAQMGLKRFRQGRVKRRPVPRA